MSSSNNYSLYQCVNYDGHHMPKEFADVRERIENFEVRNDDVWISSYPKSGSTWLQELVWLIGNNLDYEKAKVQLDLRSMFVETNGIGKCWSNFSKENGLSNKFDYINFPNILDLIEGTKERRYMKTHLPWYLMPKQIKDGIKTPKIIHILRNPKQVVPSYYYHATEVFPIYKGDLDIFIDLFMEGKLLFGEYFNTVLSYWEQRHRSNILFLTYEGMHGDLPGTIQKVADFLNITCSPEQIAKLAKHLSFDEMKRNMAVNKQLFVQDANIQFIRKGSTDSYKEELTPEMIDKLDEWIDKHAKGTDLPYERK